MKLGIRGKLFLLSLAMIIVALLGGGAWSDRDLRLQAQARIESQLLADTLLAREAVELMQPESDAHAYGALARRLGRASGARMTIIAVDGRVLADSNLQEREVALLENHGQRPEVLTALSGTTGVARRGSTTLHEDMLYIAVPYGGSPPRGVVRSALSLHEVSDALHALRTRLGAAGVVALLIAGLMSWMAAQGASSTLRNLLKVAREMASGSSSARASVSRADEIGGLAGSLNQLASALQTTVSDLAAERDRFGAVLEGMAEAVVALDADGRVSLCNSSAQKLLGWGDSALGLPLSELVRVPALHELVARARVSDGKDDPAEFTLRGQLRVVARAARLSSAEGGVVMVLRDVTELRRLEGARRDFVANVSHELRTPVSTIQANAEALLAGALDDKEHAERFLSALMRNTERLARIISDLLDLSRIEAGEYTLDLQPLSLRASAQRAGEAVVDKARSKQLSLQIEVTEGVSVLADDKALEHVLVNLLDNAVKYTPDKGHVVIRASMRQTSVRIEVCDDGPGIEPRFRERIFERFYRLDPGRSRELGGTGLGLSIVKHLVEAMHGQVGVESGDPLGSVFWIELPEGKHPTD
ncbi:MAG: PAS domain-containing protein [Deltaproteobacteria bacterium]|nr:PAS domain-containing protein [Deltaproteobacteria bacterium]